MTKVKKYSDFIAEGLWKSGVNRAKSGEEREENKIRSNISELKPVNACNEFPFLFADDDFIVDGNKNTFTWHEVEQLKPYFEKNGWRLIGDDETRTMQSFYKKGEKCPFRWVEGEDDGFGIKNTETDEVAYFKPVKVWEKNYSKEEFRYWTDWSKNETEEDIQDFFKNVAGTVIFDPWGHYKVTHQMVDRNEEWKIRLVKDK